MKSFKIIGIIIGIVIFLLLALGSIYNEDKAEKVNSKLSKEIKSPKSFKIGDEIKFDNVIYTVNSFKISKGSEHNKPIKAKHVYCVVDITIENKSNKIITTSSILTFKLVDSQGYHYDVIINTDARGQIDGEIQTGKKIRGELSFEVPENENKFELDIDPSLFDIGKFTVDLSN